MERTDETGARVVVVVIDGLPLELRGGDDPTASVVPSVDELGHTFGIASERPQAALAQIDGLLARKLAGFGGEVVVSADHGLTDTHTHLDLRGIVEGLVGTTIAYPFVARRLPQADVCESGNGMAPRVPARGGRLAGPPRPGSLSSAGCRAARPRRHRQRCDTRRTEVWR